MCEHGRWGCEIRSPPIDRGDAIAVWEASIETLRYDTKETSNEGHSSTLHTARVATPTVGSGTSSISHSYVLTLVQEPNAEAKKPEINANAMIISQGITDHSARAGAHRTRRAPLGEVGLPGGLPCMLTTVLPS